MMRGAGLFGTLVAVSLTAAAAHAAKAKPGKAAVETVDRKLVCMVNDKVLGRPQTPVTVEGKTYYGCCPGCVGRLNNDPKARFAKDPLTGRDVDKAKAVILEGDGGRALYFESLASAQRYLAGRRAAAGS